MAIRPTGSEWSRHWALEPGTVYLNHGSFGATPTHVLDEQSRLRALLERDPTDFFFRVCPPLWQQALEGLSQFLKADPAGMAFVTNATLGVNTVLRGLQFQPRDEILLTDHAYQACANAIDFACGQSGASAVPVSIPFRAESEDQIVELMLRSVTHRTKLAMIETVTSPTARRLPFERLTAELQRRGVDVLIDAAHGPGLLELDLRMLDAAYVVGNCHKWLCTPKGSGFLHVRHDRRHLVEPLTISHGFSSTADPHARFRAQFDWQGTQDPTPWLCIPAALEFIGSLMPGGWAAVMDRNRALALRTREILSEVLGPGGVAAAESVTAMTTAKLPGSRMDGSGSFQNYPLMAGLHERFNIRAVVFPWAPHQARYLRVSSALYNSLDESRYFAGALRSLL